MNFEYSASVTPTTSTSTTTTTTTTTTAPPVNDFRPLHPRPTRLQRRQQRSTHDNRRPPRPQRLRPCLHFANDFQHDFVDHTIHDDLFHRAYDLQHDFNRFIRDDRQSSSSFPTWAYVVIGAILIVVVGAVYLVRRASAQKAEGVGHSEQG
jgi:hypothetical protein